VLGYEELSICVFGVTDLVQCLMGVCVTAGPVVVSLILVILMIDYCLT
jgi:hypothetical protein